jgi:hypothetical protein
LQAWVPGMQALQAMRAALQP